MADPLSDAVERPPGARLESWKEIAAHLGRTIRTVQRWERYGLPVHRQMHSEGGSVYAYKDELDAWCSARTVRPPVRHSLPRSPQATSSAQLFYAICRQQLGRDTRDSLLQAVHYAQLALEAVPNFAAAHAALSYSYVKLAWHTPASTRLLIEKARAVARKALDLDSTTCEAYLALGLAHLLYDRDVVRSGQCLERAQRVQPANANAHQALAIHRLVTGNTSSAIASIVEARNLDPVSPVIAAHHAWTLILLGQSHSALDALACAMTLDPFCFRAHLMQVVALLAAGDLGRAERALQRARMLDDVPVWKAVEAELAARRGHDAPALDLLDAAERDESYVPRYWLARAAASLRDDAAHRACRLLSEAIDKREADAVFLTLDPAFEPLRNDATFLGLARQLGVMGHTRRAAS
jgi:tetratricopeptide (TPR) repeat protein